MPKLEYFLVAESTSVDRDTNSISIFNVYNERRFEAFPLTIEKLVLVTCWISTEEETHDEPDMQAEVIVTGIPGADVEPFRVNFTCDVEFQHVIFHLVNVDIPAPCLVEIELKVNGAHEAWHRIRFHEA